MTTKHAHPHEHATPHAATGDVALAARNLHAAAHRLGPRLTEHGFGCPAQHAGPCICGSEDFQAAVAALGTALRTLPGTPAA